MPLTVPRQPEWAAPTAPGFFVPEQQGGAVGGEHHQGKAGDGGNQTVAFFQMGGEQSGTPVFLRGGIDNVRMGLPGKHQIVDVKAQSIPQAAVIFNHIVGVIPPAGADVQG